MEEKLKFWQKVGPFVLALLLISGLGLLQRAPADTAGKLAVSFLDVGQGDAALIKTPGGHYYLIDGGPDKSVLSGLGSEMPPTQKNLDGIILTHPHADHVAGLNYVLDRYTVGKVYLTGATHTAPEYVSFLEKVKQKSMGAEKIEAGKSFIDDNTDFKFFWPPSGEVANSPTDINETSAVLRVTYGENAFLFLGDLPAKTQEKMMASYQIGRADVVKISHHGSKDGTSEKLIALVAPKYAVISVGADNDFGHPAPSTLAKLSGQIVYRTDQNGIIRFVCDGKILSHSP